MDQLHSWYKKSLIDDFNGNFDEKELISRLIRILKSIKAMKEGEMAKLSEKQIEELNKRKDEPIKKLAEEFGVSTQAIKYHRTKANKNWRKIVKENTQQIRPETDIVKNHPRKELDGLKILPAGKPILVETVYPLFNNKKIDENIKFFEECRKLNNAVDLFADEMKHKLQKQAKRGITGWDNIDDVSRKQYIQRLFTGRLKKQKATGNQEVDLANYIMFLYFINNPGMLTK